MKIRYLLIKTKFPILDALLKKFNLDILYYCENLKDKCKFKYILLTVLLNRKRVILQFNKKEGFRYIWYTFCEVFQIV